MTRLPAGSTDLMAAAWDNDPFGDRFPTQPLAVGRHQVGRAPSAYRRPAPARHRARRGRSLILVVVAVLVLAAVIATATGVLGDRSWSVTPSLHVPARSAPTSSPAATARQAEDVPRLPVGEADGVVPDGVTVFDDGFPAVARLDPGLLKALRRAAKDAARGGVKFYVNSGWRSPAYQNQLLREAVSTYGSEKEAARWVATADTSPHVSGDAVDIGKPDAAAWLSKHGADYGLCQIYRNEPWHYELRPHAADDGCPRMYADPTHDPRMQK
jgi:D-alanyl-D-alanine carboxypeptidase